jgi:SAM-dependent methyltransferase
MIDNVKAHNEAIASDYSNLVYDPILAAFIDPDRVFGQAAMFGDLGRPVDVLDLACGTGAQLLRVAEKVAGRLVGVDISPGPIRMAQERLAPFGSRADVRCADLLETDAASLGQFDLIYNIGVIYATPPTVQRRILDLIGQCLRPGGVAVLSYHSGGAPALRGVLHRILVAGLEGLDPAKSVAAARLRSASLRETLSARPGTDLLLAALTSIDRQSDLVFYHEVFNSCFGAMQTSVVARDLAAYGLEFAWYGRHWARSRRAPLLTARLPQISPTSPTASIAMPFLRATLNPGCARSPIPGCAGVRSCDAAIRGSLPESRILSGWTAPPAPRSAFRHRWRCSIAWPRSLRSVGMSWCNGRQRRLKASAAR